MEIIRAVTEAHRAGAYYVRIQAMARKHHITLEQEFDEHDGSQTRYIVIRDDVLPVATCRLYPEDAESMMLGRVVVLPEYRGQGLGRAVMTAAEDWSRELGYRKRSFMESVDSITRKYGRGSITLAKGFEKQGWEMKRNFLSPCWTTRYQDIPKVY